MRPHSHTHTDSLKSALWAAHYDGKMFAVKKLHSKGALFDIKCGEIIFQGKNKTVWYAKITDNCSARGRHLGHRGLQWFTGFGWDVDIIDLRYPPRCF